MKHGLRLTRTRSVRQRNPIESGRGVNGGTASRREVQEEDPLIMVMEVTDSLVIELVPNFLVVDVAGGEDVAVDDSVEEVSGIVVTDDHHAFRGARVQLCGWVALHRVYGGLTFLNLRDHTGIVQCCICYQGMSITAAIVVSVMHTIATLQPFQMNIQKPILLNDLRLENVVAIEGIVKSRPSESINKKMKTGFIEVAANKVQVLNSVNSKLPFLVTTADDAKDSLKEEIRLRYRCLDLRRQQMNFNILLRHKVVKLIRRYLENMHGFVEVLSSRLKLQSCHDPHQKVPGII
ncbi:OB-fold nucleic acid binding domain, AA-tRNA synthetase-type [Sesbania bispinosa]|nr:OB-fold nucleic acid binding domain, AA-tRNA synthetase-type [Sesbania bispinosa]